MQIELPVFRPLAIFFFDDPVSKLDRHLDVPGTYPNIGPPQWLSENGSGAEAANWGERGIADETLAAFREERVPISD